MKDHVIKLGVPKGSLERATIELFQKAGWKITISERSYFPSIDDPEISCNLVRAQEMARYVENGVLDAGPHGPGLDTGKRGGRGDRDRPHLLEGEHDARRSGSSPAPPPLPSTRLEDCAGKTISTELVGFTKRYFAERNIPVKVEFSWGATEAKAVDGLVDAIVEVTETGTTLRANGLKIVHTLLETNTKLIANRTAMKDPAKKRKIQHIALLLRGALAAGEHGGAEDERARGELRGGRRAPARASPRPPWRSCTTPRGSPWRS